MRLFIAIELPASFKKEVARVRAALKAQCTAGRFVPEDNFHMTLHFIGESADIVGAAAALREGVRGIRPFTLHLGGCGAFARTAAECTAVLHVAGELAELDALYESLGAALSERGFSRERRGFTPHITLGRSVAFAPGAEAALAAIRPNASMQVQAVTLFESRRENGRMVYTALHRQSLG